MALSSKYGKPQIHVLGTMLAPNNGIRRQNKTYALHCFTPHHDLIPYTAHPWSRRPLIKMDAHGSDRQALQQQTSPTGWRTMFIYPRSVKQWQHAGTLRCSKERRRSGRTCPSPVAVVDCWRGPPKADQQPAQAVYQHQHIRDEGWQPHQPENLLRK